MTCSVDLLEPKVVHTNILRFRYKEVINHDPVAFLIDCRFMTGLKKHGLIIPSANDAHQSVTYQKSFRFRFIDRTCDALQIVFSSLIGKTN